MVLAVLTASVVPVTAGADQPPAPGPLSTLGSCVVQQHRLDVLFLLDTSRSLQTTDSGDQRQVAARVADGALAQLAAGTAASPSAQPVRVDIAVARFDATFSVGDWHDVASGNTAVQSDIDADTPNRPTGSATDYVLALSNAQQVLAARAAATDGSGQPACQALIWFTDGGYEPNGVAATDQEWASGTDQLCGPGKIVDQLRTAEVTIVTVALTSEIPARGIDLLKQVTADPTQPPSRACGGGSPPPGEFLPVERAGDLIDGFLRLPKLAPPVPLCQSDQCSFTLEPELRSFFVLIHTAAATDQLWLWPPRGAAYQLTGTTGAASVTVSGAQLQLARVNPTTFTITGTLPAAAAEGWQGTWKVTLANGAGRPVSGQVFLFGDLAEKFVAAPSFRRGTPWRFDVLTTAANAQPVTRLDPLHPSVTVTITDGTDTRPALVQPDGTQPGLSHVSFRAPATWHSASVRVTVTLTVHTGAGVDISPPALRADVPVVTPLALGQDQLRVRLTDRDPTSARLTVSAGDQGGCVWWEPQGTRWTPAPTTLDVTVDRGSRPDCLRIPPHGHGDLRVQLTAAHGWSGTIQGQLVVAQSVAGGAPIEVDVPVTARLTAHPDANVEVRVWLILGALTLLPLVLALLLTHIVVRRLHRPRSLRIVSLAATVRVGAGHVDIQPVGGGDWPAPDHLGWPEPVPKRRLTVGPVTFRAVSRWWDPFATPRTRAIASRDHELVTESDDPAPVLRRLPLNLAGTVVLAAPRERPRDGDFEVEVVAVIDTPMLDRRTRDDIARSARFAARRLLPAPDPAESLSKHF